uniref:Uncharacterized protein n=1 Tax=Zea mays TaxID=4577 RepID=B4FJ36_MAIZE|nr:unknown [Zea mays]
MFFFLCSLEMHPLRKKGSSCPNFIKCHYVQQHSSVRKVWLLIFPTRRLVRAKGLVAYLSYQLLEQVACCLRTMG